MSAKADAGAGAYDREAAIQQVRLRRMEITEQGLVNIAEHKYVPGVYTPLDNFLNSIYWTPCVEFLPRWLAPNLVTFIGLFAALMGLNCIILQSPDMQTLAPRWAYAVAGVSVFFYQTMDCLDGKQARRTGSSSPMGQLFDHGCDSVVSCYVALATICSLQLGFTVRGVLFLWSGTLPFWLTQWAEYYTHELMTSMFGLVGVTELQLVAMSLVSANAIAPGIFEWRLPVDSVLPGWWCGRDSCPILVGDGVLAVQFPMATMACLTCFAAALRAAPDKAAALKEVLPAFALVLLGSMWCLLVPQTHPRIILFTLGMTFTYKSCKMIVASMSRMQYAAHDILLPLPVIFWATHLKLLPGHGDVALGAYLCFVCVVLLRYLVNVCEELSHYLGIHTFKLGPRKLEAKGKKGQ